MTIEQQARDLLERMEVKNAQSFTAGELVELADLISEKNRYADIAYRVRDVLHCGHIDNVLISVQKLNTRYNDALARIATTQEDAARYRKLRDSYIETTGFSGSKEDFDREIDLIKNL